MAGDVEKALSQYREAEAIFKNLGKTDGYEMASLYNNISQIYQEQEEHEKALESLDKALELIKRWRTARRRWQRPISTGAILDGAGTAG
ncbi:MAG: tetratricopeptide repeat protein [Clostridium fessum]